MSHNLISKFKNIIMYIALISFVLLFVSCAPVKNEAIEKPSGIIFDDPSAINLFISASKEMRPNDEFTHDWQMYIKDKYDLQINLIYIGETYSSRYHSDSQDVGIDTAELSKYKDFGGFIYSSRRYNLDKLTASGLIEPVDEYIAQIPDFAVLSDLIINQFSYDGDSVWALPMSHQNEIDLRVYNGDWLSEYDQGLPVTIDDFLSYAYYIRDNDPDNNGIYDTYIQAYNISMLFSEFMDVFRAYGCYPMQTSYPIGYNPNTSKFEICVFNEGYIQAMNFIKFLEEENLVKKTTLFPNEFSKADFKIASSYAYQYNIMHECSVMTPSFYLTGDNNSNLVKSYVYPWCLAVLDGTEDVVPKLGILLNVLAEETNSFVDFECGIENISYQSHENYFTYSTYGPQGNKIPLVGMRTNIATNSTNRKMLIHSSYVNQAEEMLTILEFKNRINSDMSRFDGTELLYSVSLLKYGNVIDSLNNRIVEITEKLNYDILTNTKSFDEAIADYKQDLIRLGIFDELEQLNNQIGN